jgi:glycosyltransferase involved in cell wall biosynthesis
MTTPSVSVVVPTRNRAEAISVALEALARQQGHTSHEVIVVDNNSTDTTRDIINGLRGSFSVPLHYVFETRPGPSHARNAGIAAARAPLLAFADDDVQVETDWIDRIQALADRHPAIECFGGKILPVWHEPPPAWLDRRHWSPLALTDHGDVAFTVSAARPLCLISANLAVRRQAFERVGGFSPDFPRAQDHEWQLRFWRGGGVGMYDPSLVVWADVTPDRLTRRYHRRWHLEHGRFSARMHLRELTDRSGGLREGALPEFRRWAGVPRFLVRMLATECLATLRHTLRRAPLSETLAHLHGVYDACGGIAEEISQRWTRTRRWNSAQGDSPSPLGPMRFDDFASLPPRSRHSPRR